MKHLTCLLALFLGSAAFGRPQEADAEHPQAPSPEFWRDARNCGPNALYLLLRAHGADVAYEELLGRMDVGPRGTSLLQLKQASQALGVPVEILEGTPESLRHMRLPVLAHMEHFTGDMTQLGHFLLVTSVDGENDRISVYDGTTALHLELPSDRFAQSWSGYLLRPRPDRGLSIAMWAVSLTTAWIVFSVSRPRRAVGGLSAGSP